MINRFDTFDWNLQFNFFQINFIGILFKIEFTDISKKESLV